MHKWERTEDRYIESNYVNSFAVEYGGRTLWKA